MVPGTNFQVVDFVGRRRGIWNEAPVSAIKREDEKRSFAMAGGWARDGAVQDQIDDTVKDAVLSARARLPAGEGSEYCEDCGELIPERRREALPGTRTCVACQSERDEEARRSGAGINRRGSKDSQLR
jgi:phage/conjugal plasmid C-4 type zinc finger TraR family protein